MGDGRVGQHAFEIFLNNGHQIAQGHGDDGQEDQDLGEVIAVGGAQGGKPQQNGHGRDLGGSGDIGHQLVGAALIDIRGPEVDGEGGQFEEKTGQGQE